MFKHSTIPSCLPHQYFRISLSPQVTLISAPPAGAFCNTDTESINAEKVLTGKGLSFTELPTWGPLHLSKPEHPICQDYPLITKSGGTVAFPSLERLAPYISQHTTHKVPQASHFTGICQCPLFYCPPHFPKEAGKKAWAY